MPPNPPGFELVYADAHAGTMHAGWGISVHRDQCLFCVPRGPRSLARYPMFARRSSMYRFQNAPRHDSLVKHVAVLYFLLPNNLF